MPFDSHSPRIPKRPTSFAMLLAAAVVLVLLVPSQQRAVAKGVFFDPDSPAGKEYALPLEQAREEAAGVGTSDGPAGKKTQLFGEGVSPRGSGPGSSTAGGDAGSDSGAGQAGDGARRGAQDSQQHRRAVAVSTALAISSSDHYAPSSAVLWVAAVVALGGIAGLALRVAQRPRPT